MSGLGERLRDLDLSGNPIRVALVGAGYVGSGILNVIGNIRGMEVVILADLDLEKVGKVYEDVGISKKSIVHTDDVDRAVSAIEAGKKVATDDLGLFSRIPRVDVVIDGTTSPKVGAYVASEAMTSRKHVVTTNLECDVTVGHILKKRADSNGVIYTATAGEEPAVIKELCDHADALGFEIIAAGKGKNNPLQLDANPQTVAEKVPNIGITARQVTSFIDGSKTMVEMACAANAVGLVPDVRGMHGAKATLDELTNIFRLREEGGILSQKGVVDYVVGGGVDPGVFVVITTGNKRLLSDLNYLKVGRGPNYILYNPYHLWFIDTPLSVVRAVLKKEPTIVPKGRPTAAVAAVAKRSLKAGETLDGIGAYCVYGTIEKWEITEREMLLPYGLTEDTKMVRDVGKGELLTYDDVMFENSVLLELRRQQDDLFK